jgi:hypothetical protein
MDIIADSENKNRVIVLINDIDLLAVKALRFAKTISDDITAFSVVVDESAEISLRMRWNKINTDIPCVIRSMPDGRVVNPLLEFINSREFDYLPSDMITIVLPRLIISSRWHSFLHKDRSRYIERQLLKHKDIVVFVMPFYLAYGKAAQEME